MRLHAIIPGLLASAALCFGQLDSNSVTVSASRNATVQPDQIIFTVSVTSGLTSSLDDVVAALQGSGITAANLTGVLSNYNYVGNSNVPTPYLEWQFGVTAALTRMKETVAQLTSLQQSVPKKNKDLQVAFSVQGTQVSPQLAQSQTCSVADLIADARAQAQKYASASGLAVGSILAMSSTSVTSAPIVVGALLGLPQPFLQSTPVPCAVTIKFALLRY
jgi:uncharacterized protein YggE